MARPLAHRRTGQTLVWRPATLPGNVGFENARAENGDWLRGLVGGDSEDRGASGIVSHTSAVILRVAAETAGVEAQMPRLSTRIMLHTSAAPSHCGRVLATEGRRKVERVCFPARRSTLSDGERDPPLVCDHLRGRGEEPLKAILSRIPWWMAIGKAIKNSAQANKFASQATQNGIEESKSGSGAGSGR
jgi:hypothetical protein